MIVIDFIYPKGNSLRFSGDAVFVLSDMVCHNSGKEWFHFIVLVMFLYVYAMYNNEVTLRLINKC